MGPKTVKNGNFQRWSPTLGEGQTDLVGPFWACFTPFPAVFSRFQPFLPILAQFLPGLETVMQSNTGPKMDRMEIVKSGP